jgi:uncharacterized protein (TIGR03435 family)
MFNVLSARLDQFRPGRVTLLCAAGIVVISALLTSCLLDAPVLRAQGAQASEASLPSFEVASIKPNHSGDTGTHINIADPSRFVAINVTAKFLVTYAYNMRDYQVSGGPAWIASDRFDIVAKVEDSLAREIPKLLPAQRQDQMRLLVRSLVADRFKLSVSHETKQLPVYALVVAKGGSKLKEVPPPNVQSNAGSSPPPSAPGVAQHSPQPGGYGMDIDNGRAILTARAIPISNLVNILSQPLGRPLVDQTGLKGTYDIALKWTPDDGPSGSQPSVLPDSASESDAGGGAIFTALQEQLGLRLESTKGPVDTIVIDHIEMPSEN